MTVSKFSGREDRDPGGRAKAPAASEKRARSGPASVRVTDVLRDAILSGRLAQGAPLRQEEIARSLAVSRMPVREALRVLETEGLVTFRPRYGFSVTEFRSGQIMEVAEMRLALETIALRYAIPRHTPETLRVAEDALLTLNDVETRADLDIRPEKHRQFHLAVYGPCSMDLLLSAIASNLALSEGFARIASSQFEHVAPRDKSEHRELLDKVAARDEAGALDLLTEHVMGQARRLVSELKALSEHEQSALG